MRIFSGELRKLCSNKYVFIILAVLLCANCALCDLKANAAARSSPDADAKIKAYDDYLSSPDEFTAYYDELLNYLSEQQELALAAWEEGFDYTPPEKEWRYTGKASYPTAEIKFTKEVLEASERAISYGDSINAFINQNKTKLREYEARGDGKDSYIYRYTEYTIGVYQDYLQEDIGIGFEYVHGWEEFYTYHEGGLFAFEAISVLCCSLMLGDKSSGFYSILSATKRGRGRTVCAKLGLCALLAAIVSVLFTLSSLGVFASRMGLSSPLNAIQALPTFTYLPFECSVIGYLLIVLAVRAAVSVSFALIVCALAAWLNNYIYSYLASVTFIGLNLGLYLLDSLNTNGFFKVNNLHSIWSVFPLFIRVRAFDFFTYPLDNRILLPVLFALISTGLSALTLSIYHRTGTLGKSRLDTLFPSLAASARTKTKRKRRSKARSVRLLPYELYKLTGSLIIPFLIAGLLFCSLYMAKRYYKKEISYNEAVYNEYMDDLSGPSCKESDEYIENEKQRITTLIAQNETMRLRYQSGELTAAQFNEYMNDYYDADGKREVFELIKEHQKYIKDYENTYGVTLWYLHDIGYEKLFASSFDIFFYFAVIILFIGVFSLEYKSNSKGGSFYSIMQSTKNGREKTFAVRLSAAGMIYLPLWLIFTGSEYLIFIKEWGLPQLGAPLASIHAFENLASSMTVGSYLIVSVLVRLLGGALLTLIVCAFSQFAKKPIPAISAVLILTLVPHALVLLGVDELSIIDFTSLLDCHSLIRLSIGANGLSRSILVLIAWALIASVLIAAAFLQFTKRGKRK